MSAGVGRSGSLMLTTSLVIWQSRFGFDVEKRAAHQNFSAEHSSGHVTLLVTKPRRNVTSGEAELRWKCRETRLETRS